MKTNLSLKISNLAVAGLLASTPLQAGTVTNIADSGTGSLRDILAATVNGETIDFDSSLAGSTIVLTSGELAISGKQITIDASSLLSGISISGNNNSRILNIGTASEVTLKKLTLRNGKVDNGTFGDAGALLADGGVLNMSDCTIKDSRAKLNGGGLFLTGGVQVAIDRCSIVGNQGDQFGGGIFFNGITTASITNSVISGNRSLIGGGIYNQVSSPSVINCTIQGNAGEGVRGQSFSFPFVTTIRNCIIWGNRTGSGTVSDQQIKSENKASADVDYSVIEGKAATLHNLNGTDSANTPKFVTPVLPANAPVSTADVRLLINSTSINAGNNADATQPLDRAGFPRIQEISVDMGAFENGYVTFAALHPLLLPAGDENHNGISNYQEYALGIDPAGTQTFPALPAISTSGGFRYLTSSHRINGLDVFPSWTTSTTLQALSWQPMLPGVNYLVDSTSILAPGRQQLVFKLLDADPSRFYRQEFSSGN